MRRAFATSASAVPSLDERSEEINRFFNEESCTRRARDEYVEDLIERFFDKADSLLE